MDFSRTLRILRSAQPDARNAAPWLLALSVSLPGLASATGAQWDSAAAGFAGSGTSNATPWISSPALGSVLAEWNVMSYPSDTTPDIAGSGTLTETTGTAFATGGGNIYSFSGPTAFTLTLNGLTAGDWTVYLRTSTLGTSVMDEATVNGVGATRSITYTEAITGGFGGGEEESLWTWSGQSVTGTLTFNFESVTSSMSLDQVAVYAVPTPVPEPSTWALMVAGLGALGTLASRRTQAGH